MQMMHKNRVYSKPLEDNSISYKLRNIKRELPIVRTNFGKQKNEYQLNDLLNSVEEYVGFSVAFTTSKRVLRSFFVGAFCSISGLLRLAFLLFFFTEFLMSSYECIHSM